MASPQIIQQTLAPHTLPLLAEYVVFRRFCWNRLRTATILVHPQYISDDDWHRDNFGAVGICGACGKQHAVTGFHKRIA